MSSNNLIPIENNLDAIQSTNIFKYSVDSNRFEHNNKCRVEFGLLGGTNVSHTKSNIVDVENELLGITKTNSKCPTFKYIPPTNDQLKPSPHHKCKIMPELDLSKNHLKPCNFFDYQEIPKEPTLPYDKCPYAIYYEKQ